MVFAPFATPEIILPNTVQPNTAFGCSCFGRGTVIGDGFSWGISQTIHIRTHIRVLLFKRINPIPDACRWVHVACTIIIQSSFLVELLAVELVWHFFAAAMLVNQEFAVRQVGIILCYVAVLVGCSGCVRDFCSSGSSDACLTARVAPEEFCCYRLTKLQLKCVAVMLYA